MDDDDLSVREDGKDDDDWRTGADVGEYSGDFDQLVLYIREFLQTRVDGDEELQQMIQYCLFRLRRSNRLDFGPKS
jgi:hypothetical protein